MGKNTSKTTSSKNNSEPKKIKSVIYTPLPKDRPPTEEELKQRKSNSISNIIFIISIFLLYFLFKSAS